MPREIVTIECTEAKKEGKAACEVCREDYRGVALARTYRAFQWGFKEGR